MNFDDILNGAQGGGAVADPTAAPPPQMTNLPAGPTPNMSAIMQPIPPEVQAMHRPASSPEELEQRKVGWMEIATRIASNPNLMRAFGYFGAAATGPRGPGQTGVNQLANAALVGTSAYDFGQQAEFERNMQMRKEGREAEESAARVDQSRATTRNTRLEGDLRARTIDDAVAKVKTERKKADVELKSAKTEQEKRAIELKYTKRVDEIRATIPDTAIKADLEAALAKGGLANKLTQAQTASAGATAGYYSAKTKELDEEMRLLKDLPEEEKRQFVTKTGKYATGFGSAQAQMAEYYKSNWKKANPKGATESDADYDKRVSIATDAFLTTSKDKPDSEQFLRWAALYGKGNDTEADYAEFLKWKGATPAGKTPAGASTGRAREFVRDPKTGALVEKK